MQEDIGPQRATPKRLSAINAENKQVLDSYILPKPEKITIYQETGVQLREIYSPKIIMGVGIMDTNENKI